MIDCGFPVSRDHLLKALDDNLHPTELAYIRTCLDTPRRLTHRCRDVIRMSFKGQALHAFAESSDMPKKDFIFISWVLNQGTLLQTDQTTCAYATNKDVDQPVHPRSLISTFVVRCLDSIMSLTTSLYICNFMTLASFFSWADRFESYLVEHPEDSFSRDEVELRSIT